MPDDQMSLGTYVRIAREEKGARHWQDKSIQLTTDSGVVIHPSYLALGDQWAELPTNIAFDDPLTDQMRKHLNQRLWGNEKRSYI